MGRIIQQESRPHIPAAVGRSTIAVTQTLTHQDDIMIIKNVESGSVIYVFPAAAHCTKSLVVLIWVVFHSWIVLATDSIQDG